MHYYFSDDIMLESKIQPFTAYQKQQVNAISNFFDIA